MKRNKALLFVILSALIVAAGCSGKSGNNEPSASSAAPASSSSSSSPQASQNAAPLSLTVAAPTFGVDPTGTLLQEEYEKAVDAYMGRDVDIKWDRTPWGDYSEKVPVMLAGGNIPDVMVIQGNDIIRQHGDKGLFVNLADYLDHMPNYKKFLDATQDVENYLYTTDGKLYAFYDGYMNPTAMTPAQTGSAYNLEVFEKNNIKVPTTLDELYEAAKKLKEIYPDSYPIGQTGGWGITSFMLANHVDGWIYWNGSEYVYGPTQPGYKEAVEFAHKLYAEGLIDPAFWTDGLDQAKAKALSNKNFIFTEIWSAYQWDLYMNNGSQTRWALAMLPDNPKYGKAWKAGSEPSGMAVYDTYGIVISSKAKNIEEIVKLIDYQYSEENMTLINWGVEGTTYQVVDGNKQYLPEIKNAANMTAELEKYCVMTSWSCRPGIVFSPQDRIAKYDAVPDTLFYHDGQAQLENFWVASDKYGGPESKHPNDFAPRINFTKEEQENESQVMSPIYTYVDESIVKFIKGETAMSEWDNFQAQIKKLGDYESVLKVYNSKVNS